MTASVLLRFIMLYSVPAAALDHAVADISAALADGALTELPSQRHPLSGIVGAHEAAEAGPVGKGARHPGLSAAVVPAQAGAERPQPLTAIWRQNDRPGAARRPVILS